LQRKTQVRNGLGIATPEDVEGLDIPDPAYSGMAQDSGDQHNYNLKFLPFLVLGGHHLSRPQKTRLGT
jgi:hypothetical protein